MHAASGDMLDVGPLRERLSTQKTIALFKARDLEVIRLVLKAGNSLPPHQVPGEITMHCIEGRLRIDAEGRARELSPGDLLFLSGDVPHAVMALTNASALVTIALRAA
jgi:quercetin dioxygenase-like cupin family protein